MRDHTPICMLVDAQNLLWQDVIKYIAIKHNVAIVKLFYVYFGRMRTETFALVSSRTCGRETEVLILPLYPLAFKCPWCAKIEKKEISRN